MRPTPTTLCHWVRHEDYSILCIATAGSETATKLMALIGEIDQLVTKAPDLMTENPPEKAS
jgi:hypothetical protein